jgi:hypothetical protein
MERRELGTAGVRLVLEEEDQGAIAQASRAGELSVGHSALGETERKSERMGESEG